MHLAGDKELIHIGAVYGQRILASVHESENVAVKPM